MTGLHVAEGVDLPLELITSSNGILAKKGAGKTSAAVVLLEEMHQVGVPVIVVSTELDEVTALADRIAVMYRGRIIGIVPGDTPRDVLGLMMAGASEAEAAA
mgnify:CR=1 FL=1